MPHKGVTMDATNQQPAHGTDVAEDPMFDLDRLQGLAVKAAACLAENTRLRRAGQPPGDVQPLEDYMKAAPPNIVLLALDRLAVATGLLEAVKGGVSDPAGSSEEPTSELQS